MSDNLTLEDGRTWWSSTVNVSNVLNEIADALQQRNVEFSAWLKDKSERPAPFMHFDLRGLPEECVDQFYTAATESFNKLRHRHRQEFENSSYGEAFCRLIEMRRHIVTGGRPEEFSDLDEVLNYDGVIIDFTELWSNT